MAIMVERKHYVKEPSREKPISIFLNNQPMAVSQGTPENLAELAVGFLLSEGLISDRMKFRSVSEDFENARVYVTSDEEVGSGRSVLHRVTSAGCAQSALLTTGGRGFADRAEGPSFKAEDLLAMMEELCFSSPRRNDGQCVHGCGIGRDGKLSLVREDIGRHNAMDKLVGQAWLDRLPVARMALFTTGRISYEMALKAEQSGVSVFVSHKSVTDAAIEFAEEVGLTLVGKCRDNGMQILSHHGRVM